MVATRSAIADVSATTEPSSSISSAIDGCAFKDFFASGATLDFDDFDVSLPVLPAALAPRLSDATDVGVAPPRSSTPPNDDGSGAPGFA